jgi:hypothetical protein
MSLTWSVPPAVGLSTIRLRMRPQDRMRGTRRYEARVVTNLASIPPWYPTFYRFRCQHKCQKKVCRVRHSDTEPWSGFRILLPNQPLAVMRHGPVLVRRVPLSVVRQGNARYQRHRAFRSTKTGTER